MSRPDSRRHAPEVISHHPGFNPEISAGLLLPGGLLYNFMNKPSWPRMNKP
jgi:hypothetical protein